MHFQRLAKNTLLNALTKHAQFPVQDMGDIAEFSTWPYTASIVPSLIQNAEVCFDSAKACTTAESFMDVLCSSLNR